MGSIGTATELTKEQWVANNEKKQSDFYKWLDSKDKKAFEADEFNIFEKMSLDEARKFLKPNSEKGFSYNDSDYVPEDTWYTVVYKDGTFINLETGDDLKNVKRSNLELVIQDNANTTAIYGNSNNVEFYNTADFDERNDIWRVEPYADRLKKRR